MKKLILSVCALVLLSVFHISCNKDDFQPNKKEGTVEFGFTLKAPSNSGAQKSSMKAPAAEPAAIVVSIKKANGNSAYTMQKVELYNMNGYYISKPLSLLPGSYTVEQFFVVDAAGSVMYASPVQGSPKAYLVSKPLPIGFSVGKDVVTKVVPEVLSTANSTPEDFGYTTFSFDVVNTFDFLIGVFVYNESVQNFELTTANLTVAAASKTIYTDTLAAITNKVTLNDGYNSYLLTVTKDGYKTWTDTLTAAELKLYFRSEDKGPLEVILEKGDASSESIWFITDQTSLGKIGLKFQGYYSGISINWGDGSLNESLTTPMVHNYSNSGIYKVTISGNIQNLTLFSAQGAQITEAEISNATNLSKLFLGSNPLKTINVSSLKDLKYLALDFCRIVSVDVSANSKLEGLILNNNPLEQLDISNNHLIKTLTFSGYVIKAMDFSNLIYLERLFIYGAGITSIDLSQNLNLKDLQIIGTQIFSLDISHNKDLHILSLDLLGYNQESVNKVLLDLYANVTQKNLKHGFLTLIYYDSIIPNGMASTALTSLVNDYNWYVYEDVHD